VTVDANKTTACKNLIFWGHNKGVFQPIKSLQKRIRDGRLRKKEEETRKEDHHFHRQNEHTPEE
jgi:hypothetical protein